jgi:NAD(P)-dependent dehydrogenase (short-subunit alcohol dehydrogenase family)
MKALANKIALITGASRGIGAAIAQRFAAEGATVVICARTMDSHDHLPGSLQETKKLIEAAGGKAIAISADLANAEARNQLITEINETIGTIDILVNNAAACFYFPFEKLSAKRCDLAMEVNFHAPLDLSQRVIASMREQQQGWILNISSATAKQPQGPPFNQWDQFGGAIIYGASKAALNRFSAGLAAEVYNDGIVVNSLAPKSAVITPGVEALGIDKNNPKFITEPIEAMAEAALSLCRCNVNETTGQVIYSTDYLKNLNLAIYDLSGKNLMLIE